jgi:hypothetical protein
MLAQPGGPVQGFAPIDLEDRRGLIDLLERQAREVWEYVQALKARPIAAERVDLNKLPEDWRELTPHAQVSWPRLTNGGQR